MLRHWLAQSAKAGYVTLGILALLLGVIGIVTPLLPTTPFLIIAVWASGKGSPRLHSWLITHSQIGGTLATWRNEGAIPSFTKRVALITLFVSWLMLVGVKLPLLGILLISIVLAIVAKFIATRPTPANEQPPAVDNMLQYRDSPVYKELRADSHLEAFRE